jgi:Fe-S oxidoreductase
VPPHEWAVDFPHLKLRAKAVNFKKHGARFRDKVLTSTDRVGQLAGIPIVVNMVNAANNNGGFRKLLEKTFGVHENAPVPRYHSKTLRKQRKGYESDISAEAAAGTTGKVALFTTCYGNYNEPHLGDDLISVFEHNGIAMRLVGKEQCCGMPKLELGDLDAVSAAMEANIPVLLDLVEQGWDIVAPVPSCVLMFKQEIPLMFPDDERVQKVSEHIYDPFEYLILRHKEGKLNTDFKQKLGKVAYHVACHQRVQNMGMKTRDVLQLIPDTEVVPIERCSGHDGTYAVKNEYHDISMKIVRPVVNRVKQAEADVYSSDCPMAGNQIANGMSDKSRAVHPLTLLRRAYGI